MTEEIEEDIFSHPKENYTQHGHIPIDDEYELFEHLTDAVEMRAAISSLQTQRNSYEFNGDAFHALTAFMICRKYKAAIPEWVLIWIQKGFSDFNGTLSDPETKSDLAQCLGIDTQTKLSLPTHLQKLIKKTTLIRVQEQVRMLMNSYELTIDQACDLVSARDRASENRRGTTIMKDQIVAAYKGGKWGKSHPTLKVPKRFLYSVLETFIGLDMEESTKKKLDEIIEIHKPK